MAFRLGGQPNRMLSDGLDLLLQVSFLLGGGLLLFHLLKIFILKSLNNKKLDWFLVFMIETTTVRDFDYKR